MLDKKTLNDFVSKVDHAYQQFCVWVYANNLFTKHQADFNNVPINKNCKYTNFWDVVICSLQHSWILSVARLFDPAYFMTDKTKPRLSIYYILESLDDNSLEDTIKLKLNNHKTCIDSIKKNRDNFLSHNSVNFKNEKIKPDVEDLFEEIDAIIKNIKSDKSYLKNCNDINLKYIKELSKDGVEEIFRALLKID